MLQSPAPTSPPSRPEARPPEVPVLASVLRRVLSALEALTGAASDPSADRLRFAREEVQLARAELATLTVLASLTTRPPAEEGLLPRAGRDAAALRRTDPLHSPHFGG